MPRKPENKTSDVNTKEEKAETAVRSGLRARLSIAVSKRWRPLALLGTVILLAALLTAGAYFYGRYYSKPAPPDQDTTPASYLKNVETANTVETLNSDEDKAAFYASLGALSYDEGDFSQALDYYLQSLNLTKEPQGWLYLSIAGLYEKQNDSQNALSYYQQAWDYYNEAGTSAEQFSEEKAYVEEKIGRLQSDG